MGIAEADRRVLSNAEAREVMGRFKSADAEGQAGLLMTLEETHGDHFPRLLKELSEDGLDPRFGALADLTDRPGLFEEFATVLAAGGEAAGEGVEKETVAELRTGVSEVLSGLGETPEARARRAAALHLALHYTNRWNEPKLAIEAATRPFLRALPRTEDDSEEPATRDLQPAVFRVAGEADTDEGGDKLADGVTPASFPTDEEGGGAEDQPVEVGPVLRTFDIPDGAELGADGRMRGKKTSGVQVAQTDRGGGAPRLLLPPPTRGRELPHVKEIMRMRPERYGEVDPAVRDRAWAGVSPEERFKREVEGLTQGFLEPVRRVWEAEQRGEKRVPRHETFKRSPENRARAQAQAHLELMTPEVAKRLTPEERLNALIELAHDKELKARPDHEKRLAVLYGSIPDDSDFEADKKNV